MRAIETTITVIDFETTGVVGSRPNEPWQIGMTKVSNGCVLPDRQYVSLLKVGERPFNPYAPGKHHMLKQEMAAAPSFHDLWPDLQEWLTGVPLCAHNVSTEKKVLRKAVPLHVVGPWLDTLKLVRLAHPDMVSHTLGDVLDVLGLVERLDALCPGREWHDALYDAVGCALLLEYLLHLPGWENTTIESLVHVHPGKYHARRRG